MAVCESCTEAVLEEVEDMGNSDVEEEELARLAEILGADIPDHICEATDSDTRCDCACRSYRGLPRKRR